ncbi:MAG: PilZ domain-containing protein [Nitrospira sp.]|nr:PilZ domain-containing protein [Nitrospira sp.]MDH4368620.1 PilZ domain-containing protein [Nitrospira sp.]MDH5348278.1 PilZ domain-containing protein [Nitrospira sp.]MDH5496459.1 PilZ domain-containing protein [Nitrospira sp.]MDH5725167.1 PilZ domain-containing protein [Nitrospira sp.]
MSSEDNPNKPQPRGRLRVPVDYPVSVTGDEGSGYGTVMNLTVTGGEIESHVQFAVGARVSVHVQPPGARPSITIALAIVRWQQRNRFGLEFVRFEGNAKEQLEDMLNQRENSTSE